MKLNFSNLLALITIALTLSVASTASAQEGSSSNDFPELGPPFQDSNTREDKPLLYEPEGGKAQKEQVVNTQPTTTSPKQKEKVLDNNQKSTSSKPEADALSFNFLYYIIQKFKTSDIIDK